MPISTGNSQQDCGYCSQSFGDGGMVVNADGKLASCWDTAGFPNMVVGDVWNGYVQPDGNENRWVQCSHRSLNQSEPFARTTLTELDWTLRELAVQRLQ